MPAPSNIRLVELAATILSEHAAGMDGFEAWWTSQPDSLTEEPAVEVTEAAYLAGRASAQADVDELQHIKKNIVESIENGLSVRKSLVDELHLHRELDIAVILTRLDRACRERDADLDALVDEVERMEHQVYETYISKLSTKNNRTNALDDLTVFDRPQRVRDILAARRKEEK